MSITRLINEAATFVAAHFPSGEHTMPELQPNEPNSETVTVDTGGHAPPVIVTVPKTGGILGDIEKIGSDILGEAETVVSKVEAAIGVNIPGYIAALTHLGTAHNALSSIEGSFASEVATIKAIVEEQIVAFTKRIAA